MDDYNEPCPPGHCKVPGPLGREATAHLLGFFAQLAEEQRRDGIARRDNEARGEEPPV
ncbi:hypothetical protein ACLIYM_25330 [Streptomyces fenghuangensis]